MFQRFAVACPLAAWKGNSVSASCQWLIPPPGQLWDLQDVYSAVAGGFQGLHRQGKVTVVVLEVLQSALQCSNGIINCSGL